MAESTTITKGESFADRWLRPGDKVSIASDKVIHSWSGMVERGAGKMNWVMDNTDRLIKDSKAPYVSCHRTQVSTGLFGPRRDFLQVTHQGLRSYAMYIGARDFGKHLDVSWFVTVSAGFLKRQFSKYATGSPLAMSMSIDLFSQQDLNAYVAVARNCFDDAVEQLMQELGQDFSHLDTKGKGFLSVW